MRHPSAGLALRPYVEQFHPWYIPVTVVAGTGHPCIPLLTSKRSRGGLEHPRGCETPKSWLGTPQPPLTMPHGTDPYDDITAETAVFTTTCISSLGCGSNMQPFPLSPLSPLLTRLGWGTHSWHPQHTSPTKVSLPPLCSCPPQLLAHTIPCLKNTNLKCNTWIKLIIQLIVATIHLLLFHGLFSKFKTHLRKKKRQNKIQKKISLPGQILSMLWTNKTSV